MENILGAIMIVPLFGMFLSYIAILCVSLITGIEVRYDILSKECKMIFIYVLILMIFAQTFMYI